MNKISKIVLSFMCVSSFLVSCGPKQDPIYGQRIMEDMGETTIKNDNYRNYYEIFVRSFADGNGDGIGDLKGIKEKLDYIKDLGYSGIWLMPINVSPSYHKYDVQNYYEIDPSYGTMDDLKSLINECHKKDIKIILDLVINHSSTRCEYFTKSIIAFEKAYITYEDLTEEDQKFKDFYSFFLSKDDPNAKGKTLYKVTNKNFYYEANFSDSMPELNFDSEYVKEEIKKISKFYLDMGMDGFRLDAVKYYYFNNTKKNTEFLKEFTNYCKSINENSYLVGECWDSESTIKSYYESGIDSLFYFPSSTSNPSNFLINSINNDGSWCNNYIQGLMRMVETSKQIPAPFLDNHDMSRLSSTSIEFNKFMYGLLSMLNGTTFTYYGDEVGMIGSVTPDQNVRISMPWGEKEYQTDQLSGITKAEYPNGTVKEQLEDENSILNYYKKANYLRNKFKEIARGRVELIEQNKENSYLIINKNYEGSDLKIVINFSQIRNIELDLNNYKNYEVVGQLVVDDSNKFIGKKDNRIIIPPYGIALIKD